jgi:lysylphosphatidylglycerol synthetase-like protein (DUF2156 family)
MTSPVRPTSPADQAWADLAARLTPAASLDRLDTVTARAVTTITVLGVLLTGLGAFSAGQLPHGSAARGLAAATVVIATLAVACALTAQVLTITRRLNPANLIEVQAWYQRQFRARARATQAATVLLILAALLAGATAATTVLTTRTGTPAATRTMQLPRRPGPHPLPGTGALPGPRQVLRVVRGPAGGHRPSPPGQ